MKRSILGAFVLMIVLVASLLVQPATAAAAESTNDTIVLVDAINAPVAVAIDLEVSAATDIVSFRQATAPAASGLVSISAVAGTDTVRSTHVGKHQVRPVHTASVTPTNPSSPQCALIMPAEQTPVTTVKPRVQRE